MRASFSLKVILLAGAAACFLPAAAKTLDSEAGKIEVETLASLDRPWGMTYLPDGGILISEKGGDLRIFANGKLGKAIEGLPKVANEGQGGLLDVEVSPGFATDHYVYVYYTEAAEQQPSDAGDAWDHRLGSRPLSPNTTLKGGAVARGVLDGNIVKNVTVIWRQEPKQIGRGHFGGRLAFAPDGSLFITSGERQRFDPAQDIHGNLGKIVHINADGSMPKDGPFVKQGGRPDIYTIGHRNPLGIAFRPGTGELWIDEMGPKGGDEINLIAPGKNYGWPTVSNGSNYDDSPIPPHSTRPDFTAPLKWWNPSISPSGLAWYTGDRFSQWKGNLLLGALSGEALIRLTVDGDKVSGEERIATGQRIRDVMMARDGAILVLTDGSGGELWRLTPETGSAPEKAH